MAKEADKANDVMLPSKKVTTSRRSLATPMNKLMRRLSGMPSESRTLEATRKTRLSFQTWKRRKSLSQESREEGRGSGGDGGGGGETKHEPLVSLSLISIMPTNQSPLVLKRAPIAKTEEVNLSIAKKPKLITTAARRLSLLSARPIRGNHRLRSKRVTEIVSPSERINARHYCNGSDSKRSRSAQLEEGNYLPTDDVILDEYSFVMPMEGSASGYRRTTASELPIYPTLRSEFHDRNTATTSNLFPEPLTPTNFSKSKEMLLRVGKTLFNKNPYLGIDYLIKQGILSTEPKTIAEFLTMDGLSRQAIGEYFGKLSDPLAVKVTEAFVRHLNLHQVEVDVALRRLLEKVHPDGESQKIEFLLNVLKCCYIEQNAEKVRREFRDPETIGILAYSIMLLHTTFYNRSARKYSKPMTKVDFINNNRGIDKGEDVATALLDGIYNRVVENEFRTLPD
ncbi:unnamed protein product, partial [Hydatigera taeniaeformis]|uniref:SEC7 domain-containing protein n=1 Tax=Hydatigena taeniaeformis TaxID=6205 RepID=A0A0R3WNN0_HYDTA